MSFFYSFTETLLHSLWQSALLVLVFVCVNATMKNLHPLQKRNLLYALLGAQVIISAFTFTAYFSGNSISETFSITQQLYSTGLLQQYADVIFYIYAAIVIFRLCSVVNQWMGFKQQFNKGLMRPDVELKVFTELKAYHLGIKRKVTLWYSNNIHSPLTFGFFKPMILLPFSLVNNINVQEAEAIILHELAHIKSRDYLLNWLLVATEIIYFFNPFIRIIAAKIKLEREKNCDVQVINFNYPEIVYAQALLKTARTSNGIKAFQLGAVKKTPQLLQRIQFFSEENNLVFKQRNTGIFTAFFIPLFIAAAAFYLPQVKATRNIQTAVNKITASPDENKAPVTYEGTLSSEATGSYASTANENESESENDKVVPVVPVENADEEFAESTNLISVTPVAFKEIPDSTKEFIYNIETPQGKMTKSFKLTLINGQWIMQPQWMTLETRPDSIRKAIADSMYRLSLRSYRDTLQ